MEIDFSARAGCPLVALADTGLGPWRSERHSVVVVRPHQPGLKVLVTGLPGALPPHVSVDGMTAEGPNLSHWPGNRTPHAYKADLSTGICLRFARAPEAERRAFLGEAQAVVNDHYDTDGFLSMLALVRPEVALAREEACLMAAATGDYQAFQTRRSFAVDRIVLGLPRSPRSPLAAELDGLAGAARSQRCYQWLIDHAEEVLDRPETWAELWREELEGVEAQLQAARRGALVRRYHSGAQLAVLRSAGPVHRMVLNTCAGAWRVLHLLDGTDGLCARYHDRTESWFEVVTFTPPERRDLRPLADHLGTLDPASAGSWCADPPTDPVPELYHGLPGAQEYGQITRTLTSTDLSAEAVEGAFVEYLGSRDAEG